MNQDWRYLRATLMRASEMLSKTKGLERVIISHEIGKGTLRKSCTLGIQKYRS